MLQTQTHFKPVHQIIGWHIFAMPLAGGLENASDNDMQDWNAVCRRAVGLGFNCLSVPLERLNDTASLRDCLEACTVAGLRLMVDCPAEDSREERSARLETLLETLGGESSNAALLLRGLGELDARSARVRLESLRRDDDGPALTLWAPGMTPVQLAALESAPMDGVFSSLPWWDFRAAWLVEEYERLRAVAPVIAPLDDPRCPHINTAVVADARPLAVARLAGDALLVPAALALQEPEAIRRCLGDAETARLPTGGGLRRLSGPLAPLTALFRDGDLLLLNPHADQPAAMSRSVIERRLPHGCVLDQADAGGAEHGRDENFELPGGGWRFLSTSTPDWAARPGARSPRSKLVSALRDARIAIESVQPVVDDGRFAVKCSLGETVQIRAKIFMDGHATLAAEVQWRPADQAEWQRSPMTLLGNDAWEASITPARLGRHVYRICAWQEPGRAFEALGSQYSVNVERREAGFASWYELFPRSQSPEPGRHGTLRDVMARLPEIRRMGFDVLYFPPIHPIGERNRKGRNNSLKAEPGDPGSPYAIGSAAGGHDAVHPELGNLDDFRELAAAARGHGMELALDFAIQCSPDHPWLRDNPDWFNWQADGTVKYAENPPKRYEDIVNPDFYSSLADAPRQAALWRALRDIVLFWVRQGVRIFRVDNPHTKPLPFWEWMLGEVYERHPDVIFLSEAFTRPAMMYRLAKLGFSQSYTYFTWRNTKQELTDYLIELNQAPVRHFFRPNFFVNTPDINPWFLQNSGRAGFLIRAVLAGTLSGSWGMYNGFEQCVGEAVPGKEEYLDSEKYQLRRWDMNAPGNIVAEITRLNWIRRSHPALQSHLGVRFHAVDNEHILFYSRYSTEDDSVVLAAVSLDPHARQSGVLNAPWGEWGMAHDTPLALHDLFEDRRFELRDAPRIELTPERPFVLWALTAGQGRAA